MTEPESGLLAILARHTEAWNLHDLDALMSLFADDCIFEASGGDEVHGTRYRGKVDVAAAFAEVLDAMPDAEWGNGRHYALAPDYGVSEWTLTGTLAGGRRLEVNGCDFLTVRDGKIIRKNSFRKQRPPVVVDMTDARTSTPAAGAGAGPRPWLPSDFQHPTHVPLGPGHHLRPIRPTDVELDMIAVMGSQPRLWTIYGEAWGWPPADMTAEQDRADLARHAAEMETHESFNYALFDADETALLGCVYIDPPEKPGADAEISWWVVDACVGTDLEAALDRFVPRWIAEEWPLTAPRHVGRDLTWDEWLALPDLD